MRLSTLVIFFLLSCNVFAIDPEVVKVACEKDNISMQDLRKWYTVYKGMYIYSKDYGAVGCNDFGDVFGKLVVVRDKVNPTKGNTNFVSATNPELLAYKDKKYSAETLTEFSNDMFAISEGIRKAMENAK
jgi:hypothetical protein